MIFRGQNYLSSAVRRVSSDVAGLTRIQQLQVQRVMAQSAQARLGIQQKALAAELASLKAGGSARLAYEAELLNKTNQINRTRESISGFPARIQAQQLSLRNAENQAQKIGNNLIAQRLSREVALERSIERQARANKALADFQKKAASGALTKPRDAAGRFVAGGMSAKQIAAQEALLTTRASQMGKVVEERELRLSQTVRDIRNQRLASTDALALERQKVTQLIRDSAIQVQQLQAQLKARQAHIAKADQLNAREAKLTAQLEQQKVLLANQGLRLQQINNQIAAEPFMRWQQAGRTIEHVSRLVQMLGLISGATFGYMAKSAADFNTQMTIAATQSTTAGHNTVGNVLKNAKQIGDAIQQLLIQGKTIAKPEELSQSIYDIFSGVSLQGNQQNQLKQGISLLKEFNKVVTANAGLVDMNEVTQAGITLMNDFGYSVKNIPAALNTMQAAVRYGRMTMSQFLSTFNQAAPAARAAHYSFNQMADSITFLSRKFPSIRMAATGYARLVEVISRSRDKFKAQGIEVANATGGLLPLEKIIGNIVAKYPGLIKGTTDWSTVLKDITGNVATYQARRVAVFFAQDASQYHRLSQQVNNDNNELTKSLQAAQKSSGVTWAEFVNQLRAIVLQIGTQAIPAFQTFGKYVGDLLQWFNKLDPKWKHLIGYWGTMISVGALLVATITGLLGGIVAIGTTFAIWRILRRDISGVTDDVILAARSLDGAKASTFGLKSELGQVSVVMARRVGIAALIPTLIIFHKQVGQIVDALGGWKRTMSLIGIIISGFTLQKAIKSMTDLRVAAALANGKLSTTTLLLSRLNGFVAIATVLLIYRRQIRGAITGIEKGITKLGVPDGLPGPNDPANLFRKYVPGGAFVQDHTQGLLNILSFGLANQDAKARAQRDVQQFKQQTKQYASTFKEIINLTQGFLRAGHSTSSINDALQKAFPFLEPGAIRVAVRIASDAMDKDLKNASDALGNNMANDLAAKVRHAINLGKKVSVSGIGGTGGGGGGLSQAQIDAKKLAKITQETAELARMYQKATNSKSGTDWLAYYRLLDKYQNEWKNNYSNVFDQLLSQQQDKLTKAAKDTADKTKTITTETFQDVLSGVKNMYDQFLSQEQSNFGQLFQGPYATSDTMQFLQQWGYKPTGTDYLKDLNSQISQFTKFNNILAGLGRRGAPKELIDQLRQLGPAAMDQIQAISQLSPEQQRRYFAEFKKAQDLIHKQAMKDLNAQLKSYRKFGQNVAKAIIAGIKDENVALTNTLTDIVRKMFPGLPVGATGAGGKPTHRTRVPNATTTGSTVNSTKTNSDNITHHYDISLTAADIASVDTKVKHAIFAATQRYKGRH